MEKKSALFVAERVKIPTKLLVHLDAQLKVNSYVKKGSKTYKAISKYLEDSLNELEASDPLLFNRYKAAVTTHHRAISRAVGDAADGSTFQLLDFICYVCRNKNTLVNELLTFNFTNDDLTNDKTLIKYEVLLPAYAIEQFMIKHGNFKNDPKDISDIDALSRRKPKVRDTTSVPENKSNQKTEEKKKIPKIPDDKIQSFDVLQEDLAKIKTHVEELGEQMYQISSDIEDAIDTKSSHDESDTSKGEAKISFWHRIFGKPNRKQFPKQTHIAGWDEKVTLKVELLNPNVFAISEIHFDTSKKGHITSVNSWFRFEIFSKKPITIKGVYLLPAHQYRKKDVVQPVTAPCCIQVPILLCQKRNLPNSRWLFLNVVYQFWLRNQANILYRT